MYTLSMQIKEEEGSGNSFCGELGMWNLEAGILDLILAGSDTTSTSLEWALLYMIHYPDVQAKMREEIDAVIGTGRLPELADRPSMPYTEAVMQEVLRMACVAPFGLPHANTKPMKIGGKWDLPAGTLVFAHLYHVLRNPDIFEDPFRFNPERYLDKSGRYDKNLAEKQIVFSVGKYDERPKWPNLS